MFIKKVGKDYYGLCKELKDYLEKDYKKGENNEILYVIRKTKYLIGIS